MQYAHFAMYLLWVGRICKETAVWEFFLILGEYLAEYYAVEEHRQKTEENYKAWNLFFNEYESRRMENHLLQGLQIFEEKSSKKFLDYYKQWVDLFQTLNL